MKKNYDLLRQLLIGLETGNTSLSGYSEDELNYHKAFLIDAGLAEGPRPHYSSRGGPDADRIPDMVYLSRLTPDGHAFLEKARDGSIWARAKSLVTEKGGELTLEALKITLNVALTKALGGN